ncbi:MAG: acyltransferase [Methylococcales bacterium]|nr:acyltransferase [Methylococcales bacterium]
MNNANRFSHIDALRGIAALLVVWLHVSEVFVHLSPETSAQGTTLYDVARTIDVGRIGVVVFFAISGFVICRSLNGNIIEGSKKFLIRRLLRLYPAFWVSIVLGLFSLWWLFDKPFSWNLIAANITMLPELSGEPPIIGLYWTLETELVFYLLCWLLFVNRNLNNPLILFLISAFLAFFFVVAKLFLMPPELRSSLKVMPYNLAIMFWGGFFRYWYDDKKALTILATRKIQLQLLLYLLTIIVLIPAVAVLIKGSAEQNDTLIRLGSSYMFGLAIFIAGSLVFKIKNPFMAWTGTISYSLYLVHPIILYSLFWYLKNKAPYCLMTFHLSAYIGFTIVFTIVLSAIIYYSVEKPAIDFAHKLTR